METGFRILLLTAVLAALPGCASVRSWFHHSPPSSSAGSTNGAADQSPPDDTTPPRVIEPEVARRQITVPKVRSRNLELGLEFGMLSIEDFGTNPVYGVTAAYHVTEDVFFQADAGGSTAGQTSFETLSGIQLLTGSERRFTYYDLSLGYNFLPGEAFLGRGHAMTSAFYILGGIGGTDFAGDTKFTANFGAGYRVVPSDWLAIHITVQDRVFQSSLLGSAKLTNNIQAVIGTTVFF
jgi:outer membrane beta-barrel protein